MTLQTHTATVRADLEESASLKQLIAETMTKQIIEAADLLLGAFKSGGKVLLCGNGGSAADAQHLAAELVGKLKLERPALPVIALTTDTSILTAVGNDHGFEQVFARQVEALVSPGDVVIAISTSGNAPNVLEALRVAKAKGAIVIGLTGRDGGKLANLVDLPLVVPADSTPRIQESHITIGHILCHLVEHELFGE